MALVRTLHERDIIRIGKDISIAIVYIRGMTTRISIEAPAELRIETGTHLPGDHHGHGGDRLDERGNPRYLGPRAKPSWEKGPTEP